ncbi:putative Diphosphoinositol polyphosphate phosphohydrolase 3-beta [Glarea lozoyensis 74030]|uniref:Putative Diphosphoinositol polyphosphate phosphohydrolase 3-beta n=1 Tax=Glarea lozoyensis (strain ATCC 74030 / MF5533) TaxID=1104152 RepID=H0ELX7_GLAL7|nr:putative Diphosphoinositol polyphosphate phosphohydrolase 3-beta [Glarea lozoyensis 74030]
MADISSIQQAKTIGSQNKDIRYEERKAVRLIISNSQNQIIIIHVQKGNYYKLPGGGIEDDEDHALAGEREALEETGCKISVGNFLGATEEWRNDLHQLSYCYNAKVIEDTGVLELTELEIGEGLTHHATKVMHALAAALELYSDIYLLFGALEPAQAAK